MNSTRMVLFSVCLKYSLILFQSQIDSKRAIEKRFEHNLLQLDLERVHRQINPFLNGFQNKHSTQKREYIVYAPWMHHVLCSPFLGNIGRMFLYKTHL